MTTAKTKLPGLALIAALCAGFTLGLTACTDERARTGAAYTAGVTAYDQGDYATALREWRPLAEQGDAEAQYNLGLMYLATKDKAEAVKWYRKAAEQGNADAQFFLGFMYEAGRGVPQDYAKPICGITLPLLDYPPARTAVEQSRTAISLPRG